jgi:hypothetical protein
LRSQRTVDPTIPPVKDLLNAVHMQVLSCCNSLLMPRLLLSIILLLSICGPTMAQGLLDRKRPDIIPLEGKVRRGGFYIGPGVTFTLPRDPGERELVNSGDTMYTADHDPRGRFGLYLEAGYFHATRDPVIIDYWDVGLAYKNLRGYEEFAGLHSIGETTIPHAGEGSFAERYLTLHLNANKFIQVRDYQFIQLSLGANADYRLEAAHDHTGDPLLNDHRFPPDLLGQLHFKLGYGFKLTGRLIAIPTVETPIFSIAPEDDGNWGRLQWFSSIYRPLIFSVRLMWLRPVKGFDCPPPIRQPGERGKGKRKQYKPDSYHP